MSLNVDAARRALLGAALRSVYSSDYADEGPHADAQAEHDDDRLALAARDLVRAVDALPADEQPVGWRPTSTCCNGTGFADYAAVPCPDPKCPVTRCEVPV